MTDDEQLVDRLTRYGPVVDGAVARELRRWGLAADHADDVASQVMETASRQWLDKPGERVPDDGWPGWLTVIARNHVRNLADKTRRRRDRETRLDDAIPHPRYEPSEASLDAVTGARLSAVLDSLGEPERSVLLLVVNHNVSVGDAAAMLQLNPREVRRALRALRLKIESVERGGSVKGARAAGVRTLADTVGRLRKEYGRD